MKEIAIALCFLCVISVLRSEPPQQTAPPTAGDEDSTWLLDTLDARNYTFVKPEDILYSYGWFPSIINPIYSIYLSIGSLNTWDKANGIHSHSLIDPANGHGFNSDLSLSKDERTIKKAFSMDDENDYPSSGYFNLSAGVEMRLFPNAFGYATIGYNSNSSILASNDYTKSFLGTNGEKVEAKEANIVFLREHALYYGAGLSIPFYGAFLYAGEEAWSAYCLNIGLSGSYKLSSKATQYLQLANNKDEVRYKNGTDTLRLLDEVNLGNINKNRLFLEMGLSMKTGVVSFLIDFGVVYGLPLTNALDDASWKQHTVRIYISMGFTGISK